MLERNGQVVQALRHALAGDNRAIEFLQGAGASDWRPSAEAFPGVDTAALAAGPSETQLRNQVLAEDRFALQRRSERGGASSTGFRYPPVAGTLSDELDLGIGHLGVDLAAAEGSPIQAVDDGTVLFSTYTVETGYTLVLQTPRGARLHLQALRLLAQDPGRPCGRWRSGGPGGQHRRMDLGAPFALRVVGSRKGCGPPPLVGHSALRPNHVPASRQGQVRVVPGPKRVDIQRRQPFCPERFAREARHHRPDGHRLLHVFPRG